MTTVYGWDASDFDWGRGPMDLGTAVRDGITFFTHKAWEGSNIPHRNYGTAMVRARDAGIPFLGPYFVVRTPGNGSHGSVAHQVSQFLAYVRQQTPWLFGYPGAFGQVDTEHWGYDDVDPRYGAEACDLIQAQTGWVAIHYAPRWAYGDSIPGNHPLWASSYGTNPAVPYRQAYPGDGSSGWAPYSGRTPTFLQYGSRLTIGSQPTCDANAFRGTVDQLRALITGGDAMALKDEPLPSSPTVNLAQAIDDLWHGWHDGHSGFGGPTDVHLVNRQLNRIEAAAGAVQASGAPTQAQVDAAILKAMLDPAVQKGIGDAIASHLRVVS